MIAKIFYALAVAVMLLAIFTKVDVLGHSVELTLLFISAGLLFGPAKMEL